MSERKIAVVTGASSGIGAAIARDLAAHGYHLILGARRLDKLKEVGTPLGADCRHLDVTSEQSVAEFCATLKTVSVLVNNAGGALGLDSIENAVEEDWQQMYDTNVLGLMRVTRALIPALEAANPGHVVNIGSIAGREAYPGGAGYNAAKFAVKAITQVMRMEWLGRPIKVTEVAPGMVETEFSVVRFKGDEERASKVYSGLTPLTAADVADAVVWAVTRPPYVNIDEIVMKPLAQASATMVSRT